MKGSMSLTTAQKLVSTLTGGDIKRLSGLDDTKVLKGRENFLRLRRLAKSLFDDDLAAQILMLERIDEAEVFYVVDFQDHLEREGEHQCNCLLCGFCEDSDGYGIECDDREIHSNSCVKCTESYCIIEDLRGQFLAKKEALKNRSSCPVLELQTLEEVEDVIASGLIEL